MQAYYIVPALLFMSALVLVGRFLVPGHSLSWPGTYEAFAHIWVGVLLVLALHREPKGLDMNDAASFAVTRAAAIVFLVILTFVEVAMFFARAA